MGSLRRSGWTLPDPERQLLLSRSGVYHSAIYEDFGWKRRKPARGSHAPGERWYYNNWSFNALGTIFERAAGRSIGDAFAEWIARPIGMQDFRAGDVGYLTRDAVTERIMGNASDHAAYMFHLSSRDLARFGLLYAAGASATTSSKSCCRVWSRPPGPPIGVTRADGGGRAAFERRPARHGADQPLSSSLSAT